MPRKSSSKKYFWRPLAAKPEALEITYEKLSLGTRIPENIKTLGLELTTLFDIFAIALGPLMGCHEKFCYIRTCDSRKYYYGVVIRKLLYSHQLGDTVDPIVVVVHVVVVVVVVVVLLLLLYQQQQ